MNKIIVNQYPEQKYSTIFNQKNGVFLRIEDEGAPEPFWCEYGPELMDISITNWCDRGCSFCYKGSNPKGVHMSLRNYERILEEAAHMKVSQIALGGGNPNQHPYFCEILKQTRDYDIVPSYTTNGRGLSEEILETTKRYCGAVAVSAYEPYDEMQEAIHKLKVFGIKTNIHFLLNSTSINTAISWLEDPPEFSNNINAIIFLNYKPIGRNPSTNLIVNKNEEITRFYDLVNIKKNIKIGFDSCSITGIVNYLEVNPNFIESCEAARFSIYISEEMLAYPCSFMVGNFEGENILENNIQEIWHYGNEFQRIRRLLHQNGCRGCHVQKQCLGGCPVFPEINLCEGKI